jgi:rhodanese-related sulfurtransferase
MPLIEDARPVTDVPAASAEDALAHFSALLQFETDCSDVHVALENGHDGFVVLDVRAPESYAAGHVPGAVSLPRGRINERNLAEYADDTTFVVYCAGPHCNGADKAAVALSRLGRPVKKMIGGVTGWVEEGYGLA